MKKTFLSALLLATALTTGGAKAETIFEALSTAYDTNPTLQAQRAYLRSVDENVAIAKSGFRPNIYLTGGYSDSDVHNNNVPSQTGGATLSAGKAEGRQFRIHDPAVRGAADGQYRVDDLV